MASRPTEDRHPQAMGLQDRPPEVVLGHLLDAQIAAAGAVRAALPAIAAAAELAAATLRADGKLGYCGAGSSGLMALADALELSGTFGIPVARTPMLFAGGASALLDMKGAVEDDAASAAPDVAAAGLGAGDVLICVSASGATPYTLAAAEAAHGASCRVVGLASVAGSPLLEGSDIAIHLETGAEIVAGSTRMGAATAQKIALNMLSTLAGLQLGHVHDGLMVNVTADNAKLRDRAARIVAEIAGCDGARAAAALAAGDGRVKIAVLVAAGARDAQDAERRLAATNGRLDAALHGLGTGA